MKFKYKNDKLFNIFSFIMFVIVTLILLLTLKNIDSTLTKIIYILMTFIISYLILALLDKTLCVSNGKFTFDKHSFIYETSRNEYTLNYQEIESITKSSYTDRNGIVANENYVYEIQIKNAGKFIYKYVNKSLDDAINELAFKAKIKIDE